MKYTDDNLEWHDENELVRRLDVVEAVLNLADTIDDVVDVIMSVPTYTDRPQDGEVNLIGRDKTEAVVMAYDVYKELTEPEVDCSWK